MEGECFIVAGWDSFRAVSDDGLEWQHASLSENQSLTSSGIAFGDGRCALLFKRGYFGTSLLEWTSDGRVWESHEIEADQVGHSVAYFTGKFIVCTGKTINAGHKPKVVLTSDGTTWSESFDVPGRSIMTHYAEADGRLVGVGPSGMAAATSDGRHWTVAELKTSESMISLAYGNGLFVGGGLHGQIWLSENGIHWSRANQGDEGEHLNTMIWDGDKFLGIGLGATYLSTDGRSWERVKNKNAPLSAVRGSDGRFIGNQWKGRLLVSTDGIDWRDERVFDRHVETLGYGHLGR